MSNFRHNGYLIHYNHNHDALGRFARSSGSGGGKTEKVRSKLNKKIVNNDLNFARQYADAYATEKSKLRNIRRSEEDIRELATNKVVNKNVRRSVKAGQKYMNKYYTKGFDPNNEKDRIEMAKYYTDIKLSQINIERANQINRSQGRAALAEGYYVSDPLDPKTKIPQAWSYKTSGDIRKEQKKRKNKR